MTLGVRCVHSDSKQCQCQYCCNFSVSVNINNAIISVNISVISVSISVNIAINSVSNNFNIAVISVSVSIAVIRIRLVSLTFLK